MDSRGSVANHAKLSNSSGDFDSVHSSDVMKLMAISGYSVNEQPPADVNPKEAVDHYANFVTVIPVDYPRQKFANPNYSTQTVNNQEDLRTYSSLLNDKDRSELSSMASVSTQSSHVMNRGMSAASAAAMVAEKPLPPRIPNGQLCVFLANGTCVCVDVEYGANTTCSSILKTLIETEELRLPPVATEVFSLWMMSPELEVQLKPHHKPVKLHTEWSQLVAKFTKFDGSYSLPEPTLHLRRNAFYNKADEKRLRDPAVIELLYCEAKQNVLVGRYPCDLGEAILLGSFAARITLGNYMPQMHTANFFRHRLRDYLPAYACVKSTPLSLMWPFSKLQRPDKTAPESLLVDQLKKLANNIPSQQFMLKYLKCCWAKPFYGAAFFRAQIEERRTSRMASWFSSGDLDILVAVSSVGIYLVEPREGTVLLSLKHGEFVWDCALPYRLNDPDCFPCIFVQFASPPSSPRDGNDTCVIQIFTKQALMANALIAYYANRRRSSASGANGSSDEVDGAHGEPDLDDVMVPLTNASQTDTLDSCLTNKLHRLSLATFDDEGRCLISTGSLAVIR